MTIISMQVITQLCGLLNRLIHHTYHGHASTAIFSAFLWIDLVQAQQPLAELGGWPAGAFTALGGSWLCIKCLSESKYDVLPTILFARFLHIIPSLREKLRSDENFGSLMKEVVLTTIEYSNKGVIQEWDALIVISKQDVKVQSHGDSFTFRQTESTGGDSTEKRRKPDLEEGSIGDSFEIEIITGFNMAGFEQAARLLLRRLGLAKKDDIKPRLGKLLRLWRALQIYQQYRKQTRWSSALPRTSGRSLGHSEINDNVDYYINLLNWTSSEPNESLNEEDDTEEDDAGEDDAHSKHLSALKRTKMTIHYPDAPYRENEVPVGATAEEYAVSAKDIAIMLAFTEHVCGDRYKGINPLILCIWIWTQGRLHPSDNLLITLPPSTQFIYPQPELPSLKPPPTPETESLPAMEPRTNSTSEATSQLVVESQPAVELASPTPYEKPHLLSRAPNVLDLSGIDWEVDGGTFMNVWKVLWVLSVVSSALIAFFVILSNGGHPNFATTLGLLFGRPYSIDSNSQDSGYPPSWNGRRQLRWGTGYACGVFKGKFYKRMGPTGNSLFRTTFVYAVSWATWCWRRPLQSSLNFKPSQPSSTWVLWVAVLFECAGTIACFFGIIMLANWGQTKAAFACALNFVSFSIVCALMFRSLIWKEGHDTLFWYSELGVGTAILYAAVIHCGVGPSHGPFVWYNAMVWIHTVASSCFSG